VEAGWVRMDACSCAIHCVFLRRTYHEWYEIQDAKVWLDFAQSKMKWITEIFKNNIPIASYL
jgi:hypothetical protein